MTPEEKIQEFKEKYTAAELWELKVDLERKLLDADHDLTRQEAKELSFKKRLVARAFVEKSQVLMSRSK
jgi:hypothetical protein